LIDDKIDLVLTDPPYRDESDNQPTMDMRKNGGMDDFGGKLNKEHYKLISKITNNHIIWGCNNFDFLPSHKGFLIWQKHIPENFTMSMAEIAYVSNSIMTISKIIKINSNLEKRYHPTQKPLKLIIWSIGISKIDGVILDPFLGSGTTAVACEKLNRRWIGIEISEKYCEIAKQRIKAEADQFKMEFNQ
jgi:DNA modification methylase